MIALLVLLLVAAATLAAVLRVVATDGFGQRPGPRGRDEVERWTVPHDAVTR